MGSDDRALVEAFRDDAIEVMNEWENACLRASSTPASETYQALMRCAHNLKGNASLMGFNFLRDSIHRLEERLLKLSSENVKPSEPSLMSILFEVEKFIRKWLETLVDNPSYQPENLNVLSKLEAWSATGELNIASESPELSERVMADDGTVRISAQKLENLIQLASELTLAQSIVNRARQNDQLDTPHVHEAILLCDKFVRGLRSTVLDLRMLPMVGLYKKLERAGMELSIQLRKPLNFQAEGHEVSVDKAVLNRIFDPLLHLLRNAIDHGLELPEERKKKGKDPTGNIRISAAVSAGGVTIRLKDDGRGLGLDRIRAKAVEKKLILADEILTDSQLSALIFEPGFSTAEKVTEVSGRGVGMDVVKKEIISLGGQIDLKSTPGQGTEFVIALPANVSLIDVLVVENHGQRYCVPTQDVSEILNVEDVKIETSGEKLRVVTRGLEFPLEQLEFFLPSPHRVAGPVAHAGHILLVHLQDQTLGIHVDGVVDQQQIFVRPLKGYLARLPRLTGSTVLSTGAPSLVINVKEMGYDYLGEKRGGDLGENSDGKQT